MKNKIKNLSAVTLALCSLNVSALDILLTNDDGWSSDGINTMKAALINAGHTVTLVGPLNQQSGKGGGLNTDYGATVNVVEQSAGVWSVDSTPADAVRAAFGGIMTNTPDLVISGINEGQNLGMSGTWQSGTINAALQAINSGVPAIAISAERLLSSDPIDTTNAYPHIADFTVRVVAQLEATQYGPQLLPAHTMLNINYPVFAEGSGGTANGVVVTDLAPKSNLDFVWTGDPATGSMTVDIDFNRWLVEPSQYPAVNNDTEAFKADYVTITLMNGDMSSKKGSSRDKSITSWRLGLITP